jgi:hypothetical protein
MRRAVVLLALLGMVILVYSAPMAEAALNKIRCTSDPVCSGTNRGDRLIDRADSFTDIRGKGGDDTYVERSGSSNSADTLRDNSDTSDDTYYISGDDFNTHEDDALWIIDSGGNNDSLDLRDTGYSTSDCPDPERRGDDLLIDCPGRDNIIIFDYYGDGEIESIRFTNGVAVPEGSSSVANSTTTTQEQPTIQELSDKKHPSGVFDQAKKNASSAGDWGQNATQTEETSRESTSSGG